MSFLQWLNGFEVSALARFNLVRRVVLAAKPCDPQLPSGFQIRCARIDVRRCTQEHLHYATTVIEEDLVAIRQVIDDAVLRDSSFDRNEISQRRLSDLSGRHSQLRTRK